MTILQRTIRVSVTVCVLLLTVPSAQAAQRFVLGTVDQSGELDGAPFHIRVPANWNGTLLVYAHGYRTKAEHPDEGMDVRRVDIVPVDGGGDTIPPIVDVTARETLFLSQGYALAGSAYRDNGFVTKEGVEDTVALTRFFTEHVAIPDRTLIWGESLGGQITAKIIEANTHLFDGAIPLCGAVLGGSRTMDSLLDLALAYDVTFGWNPAWGSIADVRDECESGVPGSGVDFGTEVFPVLLAQLTPQNFGRLEFIRSLFPQGYTPDLFYTQFGFIIAMFFDTEGRAEAECRFGGAPLGQNRDHFYALTDAQKAYLATLGVDANALLVQMNARRKISTDPDVRRYERRFTDLTGGIKQPVLTVHTIGDQIVSVAAESAYHEIVTEADKEDRLVQVYTNAVGHCNFTPEQLNSAVTAMNYWLDTESKPGATFFPAAQGFVSGFVPPSLPQPPAKTH